jgi:AbiU2
VIIEAARALWERLRDDPRKDLLRKIRDRVSAHNIVGGRSNLDKITYDELWAFSTDTERLIELLTAGSGIMTVRLAAAEETWSKRAEEYWSRLAR